MQWYVSWVFLKYANLHWTKFNECFLACSYIQWYYYMFLAFLAPTARKSAKRWPLRLSKRWQAQSYFVYMYTYMPREWFTRCQTFMLGICKWAWFTIALSSSYIALLPIPTPTFFSIDFLAFSPQTPKSVIILMFWRMGPKPIWRRIHLFKTAWVILILHLILLQC